MATAITPVDKLTLALSEDKIQKQFNDCLKEKAPAFITSLINLYSGDNYLQQCDPKLVIMEALKAAVLDLTIDKAFGYAYIVPYKGKPVFTLGYKGMIQLAQRSGLYTTLNAKAIPEGLKVDTDWITGAVVITGKPTSEKAQGYLAHFGLLNGFQKTLYMTKAEVISHAKKYSKSYGYDSSAWKSNFDEMAMKTPVRLLVGKYGPMSIQMQQAFAKDEEPESDEDSEETVKDKANQEVIDVDFEVQEEAPKKATKKEEAKPKRRGPSY